MGERKDSVLSLVLSGYGGMDKVKVQQLPLPGKPEKTQIKIEVKACGMNFADIYTRQGLASNNKPTPFIMGLECSGVVIDVGPLVDQHFIKQGDRVMVHSDTAGLYSEVVCVDVSCCTLIPDSMSWEDAAAFPINYLTAYFCLFDIGNLRSSQTVLIPSAAGGVGWAATQLAKTVPNVHVIGLASPSKHADICSNGVDVALSSLDPDWDKTVKTHCPEGVDIALDFASGDSFGRSQHLVRDLGRVILIGANGMIEGETLSYWRVFRTWWNTKTVDPTSLIMKSRVVAGFHLSNVKNELPQRYRAALLHLLELYKNNQIRPRIDSVWTFNQIIEATCRLSQRKNIGKVIVKPS